MTNIVGQLFKSLDPWPGFQITSFKIQVSPVDGRKTLILDLRPVEGSMPICSRCRHEAPLVHSYVSRRIKECSLLGKLFKNPCSQAELNKIVPFGFSLQRQKNGVFLPLK